MGNKLYLAKRVTKRRGFQVYHGCQHCQYVVLQSVAQLLLCNFASYGASWGMDGNVPGLDRSKYTVL